MSTDNHKLNFQLELTEGGFSNPPYNGNGAKQELGMRHKESVVRKNFAVLCDLCERQLLTSDNKRLPRNQS